MSKLSGAGLVSIGGVIGSIVTWALSAYSSWHAAHIEDQKFSLELDKEKMQIVEFIDTHKAGLALILLDYYHDRIEKEDAPASALIEALQSYVATSQKDLAPPAPQNPDPTGEGGISDLSKDFIRNQLFSAGRRDFAENIASSVKQDAKLSSRITQALVQAIIPPSEDNLRRYRVNLYIALTFSLMPKVADDSVRKSIIDALRGLQASAEYKQNATFRTNVDNALSKQG